MQTNQIASIVRDALIEGRADALPALDREQDTQARVLAAVRVLCAALTRNNKAQWPTCASNWTTYAPDVFTSRTKYLRIVEYQAITTSTRDMTPADIAQVPPAEFDTSGYRFLGPDRHARSVWAFVELSNGLVWKAATFKKPALNYPRGCVLDEESAAGMSTCLHGVTSLGSYHAELR